MTDHDGFEGDSDHVSDGSEPPGADGVLDHRDHTTDAPGGADNPQSADSPTPPPQSRQTATSEPSSESPCSDADQSRADSEATSRAGVDAFVDNTTALLRRGNDLFPFVWIAILIVLMVPTMWKLGHGYDPREPILLYDYSASVIILEVVCQVMALILLTTSFPAARACLVDDNDEIRTLDGGTDVMVRHLLDAIPLAIIYYVAVMGGLMMCILPGLFAAVFLLPALYLGTAGDESILRAFLKAPGQVIKHSTLYAILLITYLACLFGLAIITGLVIGTIAPDGDLAGLLTDPVFLVGFSLAFIAMTAVFYLFYAALLGLMVTTDINSANQQNQH